MRPAAGRSLLILGVQKEKEQKEEEENTQANCQKEGVSQPPGRKEYTHRIIFVDFNK